VNNLIGDPTEKIEDTFGDKEEPLDTDVDGVTADGFIQQGTNKFPKFQVSREEFYQNMTDGRRRLRWKSDTPVQKYMSGTKYRNPFYVSYTDENGKTYTRKIK
jgi:hypothetical protein